MKFRPWAIGLLTVSLISLASVGHAEGGSPDALPYSTAQVRKLARQAHSVEQYTAVADYYAMRQRIYARKATEAMHLWADRSMMITPLSEKWPRPVDSARNLHDYYAFESSHSAALFAKYSALADAAAK